MPRHRAPAIVTYACPRCGRSVAGLAAPIHGSPACHAKYAGLCERCVTDDERAEIEADQVGGILGTPEPKNDLWRRMAERAKK